MSADGGKSIVGMPYGSAGFHVSQREDDQHLDTAVDVVIYFVDQTGLHLRVVDGQNATASELFEMVMEEQNYPEEARNLFSLWLVSDLLELQLKPSHIPFKLVCYWEELLDKYSSASLIERQRDEPVIMFRRNVFCSCEVEKKMLEGESAQMLNLLRLLYSEAKQNVLCGRYPISQKTCYTLAGIQAVIMLKDQEVNSSESKVLTTADFKMKMSDYLPSHFCKRKWWIGARDNPEHRLFHSYQEQALAFQNSGIDAAYQKYLAICQEQPYYGCAFFRGQVEHPGRRMLSSQIDDPVYVAINLHGVYIIDEDDFVLLLGLPFEFLCWERMKSAGESDTDRLPFLLLQFPALTGDNGDTSLLQIFSKQALLMDKLIEACIQLRKSGSTMIDATAEKTILSGSDDVAKQFQRLALTTFNESRQLKKSTVRVPKSAVDSRVA